MKVAAQVVFWTSAFLIAYTYAIYPAWLYIRSRVAPRPWKREPITPTVSIVIAVHNELARLPTKLRNLLNLDYPSDRMQIIIASDGSTDGTNDFLSSCGDVTAVICTENKGKASALNAGLARATGDIVLFTDARQDLEPRSLRVLVSNFADPQVGCVSGELMLRASENDGGGVSLYWRVEKLIRKLEAASGSVVGATGAIYAVRRTLIPTIPEGTLLDDVFIPVSVTRQGSRVVFDADARAWDEPSLADSKEFRRKVRTLAGNYQLLQFAPWLLMSPNAVRLRFVSHKLLRLGVPLFLVINFATVWLLSASATYLGMALLESLFYVVAVIGIAEKKKSQSKIIAGPVAFCVLNAAAARAFFSFVKYRNQPTDLWKSDAAPNHLRSGTLSTADSSAHGK